MPLARIIFSLSEQINNQIDKSKLSKREIESRKKLFNHLKKTIAGRVKGAKLLKFGSSVSGLSLKHGDMDLCLK